MKLPFIHLNLRFNPFGELTLEQRKEVAIVDTHSLKKSLNKKSVAIQLLADHGRGKTTYLFSLHKEYSSAPYIKIQVGDKPRFSPCAIRFVDSVENMTKKSRIDLYKKSDSLAFTTHADLSKELIKHGFTVITKKISTADESTLMKIFSRRIRYAQRSEGEVPRINLQAIKKLQRIYKDDVRAMESHLYEKIQKLKGIENVEV
ncbi:hypothetical protein MNBD_GAMMA08-3034 [hydrothermal vent metagenome]|uniref:Uncharacterized protein n=1 Tax=hydrothermal vent metagenome TaxID=652676 RepID=A0A3B0YFR1_9ZZZZ